MNASTCGLNRSYFLFQNQLSDISKNLKYRHFTAKFTENNLRFKGNNWQHSAVKMFQLSPHRN